MKKLTRKSSPGLRSFIALTMFLSGCAGALKPVEMPAEVAPPVSQATANCAAPSYASDMLVCTDVGLLKLDSALAERIAARSGPLADGIESDEVWFRRSRLCAFEENHRTCLLSAYCDRLAALNGLWPGGEPDLNRVGATCD